MADIEKIVRINNLLNLYQEILSPTQKQMMLDYYVYDLSLGEIAEERKVSRSACEDAIKKGIAKLEEIESKLHILERNEKLLKTIENLKKKAAKPEDLAEIEELERSINHGI